MINNWEDLKKDSKFWVLVAMVCAISAFIFCAWLFDWSWSLWTFE